MDIALLHFINGAMANPLLDWLMPLFSANSFFVPGVIILSFGLLWKGGTRGRLFVVFLVLALGIGDAVICASIKHALNRPRPFETWPDVRTLLGRGSGQSMPSSHAANWFAASSLVFLFYRRWLKLVLPLAILVSFSRVYTGMHYPSDVLAGAILGCAYGFGIVGLCEFAWQRIGPDWFPYAFARLSSLVRPGVAISSEVRLRGMVMDDREWLRLGYVLTGVVLLVRLLYLAAGKIELCEDEAYQWLWSKHLDLSYFSKPPLIAYLQFLGTSLFGQNEFGIRFLSPVISAVGSVVLLKFITREVSARAAFWVFVTVSTSPLSAVGATLMTIDPPSVLFWMCAMVVGWTAVRKDSTKHWAWAGVWMGFGFLSKYTELFQLLSWAIFLAVWKPGRAQLRRPGPYIALGILALSTLPVIIWNQHHNWIGASHIADRGGFGNEWKPTLRFFFDFAVAEFALLNPVYFVAALVAAALVWRKRDRSPLQIYFWCMGMPLFLFYLGYTFKSRVHPNWIAPSILPMFCLMVTFWERRWREGAAKSQAWFGGAAVFGLLIIVLLHDTRLLTKIVGKSLPPDRDPLRRVLGWKETAAYVQELRSTLLKEGKPVFIIGGHYGIAGLMSFYMPDAKAKVTTEPLVYYISSDKPENQFYFWPGYNNRKGQNALYLLETDVVMEVPPPLLKEFQSVKDLGLHDVMERGRPLHRFQFFECRDLL
jgi:4-amino-4-deoxy-L-arabinose transferase-like glycosyltransferase/membrane-associated phospholipid phosphatase